jgi:hypothetical protein
MIELLCSIIIALPIWLVALELRQMNKFKNK